MPRDSNGNYTLPPGINPLIAGTDIEVDWANPTMDDIANSLTDSLSRTGSGGMLVPFKFSDGAIGAPSITWTNQPQAGWYRAGADDFRYVINGIDILQLTMAAVSVKKPLDVVGAITVSGGITAGGAITTPGPVTIGGAPAATINDAITYAVALG